MKEHSNQIVKTEDVISKEVFSPEHEKLGKIEEIVLDKVSGQAQYVVLSFNSFLGLGGKYFAFPWQAISYDKDEEGFVLNVSKDKLQGCDGFDKDNWPDMAQAEWQSKIQNTYSPSFVN